MKVRYIPPRTKDGKIQHVAIVCKNRDVLIGHVQAIQSVIASLSCYKHVNDEMLSFIDPGLDSSRFNNWIDDGIDGTHMTDQEIRDVMTERINSILNRDSQHRENGKQILDPGYFSVDCKCGNFVRWNNVKEIPYENYKCDLCDRVLIHYIHLDDEDIEFDNGKE